MAADTDVELGSSGPCCKYKQKYLNSEKNRLCLRKAIGILESRLSTVQDENSNLKKTLEEERAQAETEAKAKESAIRGSLENEISTLKSELASLIESRASKCQDADGEMNLLCTRVSEGEIKINQLQKDLDKERKRGDSEKKKAESEKKKATEAGKLVKSEKSKAEKEKRVADVERNRAEEFRFRAEASEAELNELKDRLEKEREAKDLEKKRANTEKKKATEAWNLVESEKKKYEEERRVADIEISLAEERRLCLEASKVEVNKVRVELVAERLKTKEILRKLELEKHNFNREKKQAESEIEKAEAQRKRDDEEKKKLIDENNQVIRKLDLEKQKAVSEKKRADSEIVKYEEQRKCVDEEKKKLMDEMNRSHHLSQQLREEQKKLMDELNRSHHLSQQLREEKKKLMDEMNRSHHLSQQLREERERNKALEKEILETMSGKNLEKFRSVPLDTVGGAVNADSIILFKKELQLEKLQVKHAKKLAKFEKRRNNLLKREVSYLKQEFTRFAHRLNILDDCFTDGLEGINAPAEFRNSLELQCSNTNGKVPGNKFTSNGESELLKAHFTSTRSCDDCGPTLNYSTVQSGGGCIKSISGISSELESLTGVSVRNNSPISPVYSTSTSLSDGPLVSSQGIHALTVTSPANLQGKSLSEGSAIPRFSGELTTQRINENLPMPTENVRSVIQGHEGSVIDNPNGLNNISAVGREPGDSTKESAFENETHSSGYFCSKGKVLHLQAEEPSTVHDASIQNVAPLAVCCQVDRTFEAQGDGGCGNTLLLDDLHGTGYRSSKRRKVSQKHNLIQEACFERDFEKQSANILIKVNRDGVGHTQAVPLHSCLVDTVQTCRDETTVNCEDEEMTRFFEKMMTEDYMKLLELDNEDDEQLYRMAMEAPLSPTLPEIEMPNMKTIERDYSTIVVEGGHRVWENENGNFVQSCCVDVVDNALIFQGSGGSDGSALHQINEPDNSFEVQKNVEDSLCIAVDTGETLVHQVFEESTDIAVVRQMTTFGKGTEVPCKSIEREKEESICRYFVAFPNTKDKTSFARIVAACETCMFKSSMGCQKDWVAQKVLPAFVTENNLLPEEKASVLLSLLLHTSPAVSETSFSGSTCSDSFRRHINKVTSDVEAKRVLLESCQLDILLNLIEGFLIDRRVLVYHDVSYGQPSPCDSGSIIIVDGNSITVSSRPATMEQVVSGSIIFASICATTGQTGFICAATYNILRTCLSDSSVMLTVLHVFAAVYGTKYFKQGTYSLIMAVVKSLVTLIERGNAVVGVVRVSDMPSASEGLFTFANCPVCVFSEGALSVDEVVLLLLEKLQNHAVPMTECKLMMLLESSNCIALDVETSEQNSEHETGHGGLDVDFDDSCFICKHGASATSHSLSVQSGIFNHFRDILSLLELVACYMRWSWTWTKIVPHLLKMLELCVPEKFSAAIVILLGQLGRFGINDSGPEESGVEELRCSLSSLLDQKAMRKWGLPTQFAIVQALTGLISVDFRKLVKNDKDLPSDPHLSVHINLIRSWFSQLTEEQKSWTFEVFQPSPVD